MKKKLYRAFVELSGNRVNSHLLKTFTQSRLSRTLNSSFVKFYKISEEEMEKPLNEYSSLHDLFTRRLKKGIRPINTDSNSVISPVDGIFAHTGKIKADSSFHVKGQKYTIDEMLGNQKYKDYCEGTFIILYLSPSHYHRIHSPISGQIIDQWELGKKSYPVNKTGLLLGKRPLSKNYRIITEISHKGKKVAVVKVGALNVNSIELTHDSDQIEKGEELGYFSFGSTVILLFEPGFLQLETDLKDEEEVKIGKKIGKLLI